MNGFTALCILILTILVCIPNIIIMMNLTHDWFYKALISVKVFLNNLTYFAILSCFTLKKRIMYFGRFLSSLWDLCVCYSALYFEFTNEMEQTNFGP